MLSAVCATFPDADAQALQQASTAAEFGDALGMAVLLSSSVDELELTVRTANVLSHKNIETLRDLVGHTESQMLKTKNFGRKSLNELREILRERGLAFASADKT